MDTPEVVALLGALVGELSIAVASAPSGTRAAAILNEHLALLHGQLQQQVPEAPAAEAKFTAVPLPAVSNPDLGQERDDGEGLVVYENVHESRAPGGLVKLVDKARTLNRSLQRASFEQVAMLLRKNKYLLAQARDWTAVDKRCVPTEDEPPVTANALLAPSSPYQRALEHVCSSAELDSDVYSVGLQLAALRQLIRSGDARTADAVEFLVRTPGFAVQPHADLGVEPPLWTAVSAAGFPGQTRVIHLLLDRDADPDAVYAGHSPREIANSKVGGLLSALEHCAEQLEGCDDADYTARA